MPIVVDHDQRRELIAGVVKRIIATQGMDAVTIRHVAREAGFKSAVISHYFRDKREMLNFTLESIRRLAAERVETDYHAHHDLASSFDSLLCIDDERVQDWRVWFGFWSKATVDPQLAEIRQRIVAETHEYMKRVLEAAKQAGAVAADLDCDLHARRLQALFNGIAAMAVIDPDPWPAGVQRSLLAAELALMAAAPKNPTGEDARTASRR